MRLKVEELYVNYDVSHWQKYRPWEPQYVKFLPHEILAGFKIEDVYYQLSNARASLSFMEVQDYGQLIRLNDDVHLQYVRSKFLLALWRITITVLICLGKCFICTTGKTITG